MTSVLNFYAGPGAGKSTSAALLFARLKTLGKKCELITEFAKDLTWEKRTTTLGNQLYILAKQHHKMFRTYDQVDYLITDSPLLLSNIYCKYCKDPEFVKVLKPMVRHLHNERPSFNFFINRTKEYQRYGRSQTEEEAREIDAEVKAMLDSEGVEYTEIHSGEEGLAEILKVLEIKNV